MRKLKDKIWVDTTIKIKRLVEQAKDGFYITYKTKMFLIEIRQGNSRIMFRALNTKELWKLIKQEAGIVK